MNSRRKGIRIPRVETEATVLDWFVSLVRLKPIPDPGTRNPARCARSTPNRHSQECS